MNKQSDKLTVRAFSHDGLSKFIELSFSDRIHCAYPEVIRLPLRQIAWRHFLFIHAGFRFIRPLGFAWFSLFHVVSRHGGATIVFGWRPFQADCRLGVPGASEIFRCTGLVYESKKEGCITLTYHDSHIDDMYKIILEKSRETKSHLFGQQWYVTHNTTIQKRYVGGFINSLWQPT